MSSEAIKFGTLHRLVEEAVYGESFLRFAYESISGASFCGHY